MELIHQLATTYGYPIFLGIFVAASIISLKNDMSKVNTGLFVGFTLLFLGYCLQNYGPKEITYTDSNDAIIHYTWAFTVGQASSIVGLGLASIIYFIKCLARNNA